MPHSSRQLLSHLELASLNYQPDDPIHSTGAHKTRSFHEPHCPLSFSTWCMDPSPNPLQTPFREATTFREPPGKWMWQPWNYYLWSFSLSWKSFFGVLWDSYGPATVKDELLRKDLYLNESTDWPVNVKRANEGGLFLGNGFSVCTAGWDWLQQVSGS